MERAHIRGMSEAAVAALFVASLALPTLDTLLKLDPAPAPEEKRQLATRPAFPATLTAVREFPRLFDSFLSDHFGFRKTLLRFHNYAKVCVIRVSPSPAVQIMIGRDGWLYFTGDKAVASVEGKNPFSESELAAWRVALRQRTQWLAKRGVRYLVVFAPAKPSIYPEHLPRWVRPSDHGTRLDQLLAAVNGCPDVEVLDLRPVMLRAKGETLVYQPTDTHWNSVGAFHGYAAIMDRLSRWFPRAKPIPFSGFNLAWGNDPGGDLTVLLDIRGLVSEPRPWMALKEPSRVHTVPIGDYARLRPWPKGQEPIVTERPQADIPRAVVFRDSFAMALVPYLAEHFGRAVFLWTFDIDPAVIEREHPDVVIQEYGERLLSVVVPENPQAIAVERVVDRPSR